MRVFKVSDITKRIVIALENDPILTRAITIEGEVVSAARRGRFIYFTLQEDDQQISGFYVGDGELEVGKTAVVTGLVRIYAPRSTYQIRANYIELKDQSKSSKELEKMIADLTKRGCLDPKNHPPIPSRLKTIGLITAQEGAAVGDFIKTLERNGAGLKVHLMGVRVQGIDAPHSIKSAIEFFNSEKSPQVDLIVLTRGGGSESDLATFNESLVFEAIVASKIPLVTAIGHEKDISIAEMVSSMRCFTPTAAAEFVSERTFNIVLREEFWDVLKKVHRNLESRYLNNPSKDPKRHIVNLGIKADSLYNGHLRNLKMLLGKISHGVEISIGRKEQRLQLVKGQTDSLKKLFEQSQKQIAAFRNGEKIDSFQDIQEGETITLRLKGMSLQAKITKILEK